MGYAYQSPPIPKAFIWRRLHSLTGFFLVLFLIEHLLTNSQAALFVGKNGEGFIHAVNFLQGLPYLNIVEIVLLGFPFALHGYLGIKYLWTGEYNSFTTDGTKPDLSQYPRNHAYTWQRITAWILIFGVFAHVVHMRFFLHPFSAHVDAKSYFMTVVSEDLQLYPLSKRLGFELYNSNEQQALIEQLKQSSQLPENLNTKEGVIARQLYQETQNLVHVISSQPVNSNQLLAVTPNFGMALLLIVRDVFKSPWMIFLYTVFLLAAVFHAFNGLWTFMITWGVTLTAKSQKGMRHVSNALLFLVLFLGLAAIYGSYWLNPFPNT